MKLSRVFAVIVAAGSLAGASARAQDTSSADASRGATSSTQPKARKGSAKPQPTPYGEVVNGPSTPDADGIPVANPNPLSVEKERGELGGIERTPGELTDESNASGDLKPNTDGY